MQANKPTTPANATPAQAKADKPDNANATAAKAARKPAKAKADKPDNAQATVSRGLARDAATVTRNATNFEQYSDRDTAYLRFFGSVMRKHGGKATLAQLHEAGSDAGKNKRRNPFYAGSAKATDAGAINRLRKAGYVTVSPDGSTLSATKLARDSAAYSGTKS